MFRLPNSLIHVVVIVAIFYDAPDYSLYAKSRQFPHPPFKMLELRGIYISDLTARPHAGVDLTDAIRRAMNECACDQFIRVLMNF